MQTPRDAALWLWKTHNRVNERLAGEEAADAKRADPSHPKRQWPGPELCPKCWRRLPSSAGASSDLVRFDAADWDEGEVFGFLTRYFGSLRGLAEAEAAAEAGSHRRHWGGRWNHGFRSRPSSRSLPAAGHAQR